MQKIYYDIKFTTASTDYLALDDKDMATVQITVLGLLTYLTELSISKDKDVRDFTDWFTSPDKRYHYNKKLKQYNSPQSYLAGTLNNIQFGSQRDFSLLQLQTIQEIVNRCVDIIDAIMGAKDINLQQNRMFTKLWIQENIWTVQGKQIDITKPFMVSVESNLMDKDSLALHILFILLLTQL